MKKTKFLIDPSAMQHPNQDEISKIWCNESSNYHSPLFDGHAWGYCGKGIYVLTTIFANFVDMIFKSECRIYVNSK